MPVILITTKATGAQIRDMLIALDAYIKLAVDIDLAIVAGGGELHSDCEAALFENGSKQENIWGADWLPFANTLTYESLINVRPSQNNFSMTVESADLKAQIERIVVDLLEGVDYE